MKNYQVFTMVHVSSSLITHPKIITERYKGMTESIPNRKKSHSQSKKKKERKKESGSQWGSKYLGMFLYVEICLLLECMIPSMDKLSVYLINSSKAE